MSGWLNLNESLNNLKGQISSFANNVLAENDEDISGRESTTTDYEELKKLCVLKEREIEDLKKVNTELQKCLRITGVQNGETNANNWDWTTPELVVEEQSPKEDISHLKNIIKELENEKKDLINQLEQLDSENQQNLEELVGIREHLQDENSDLKEKCQQLKHQNKTIASREEKLKQELQELQRRVEEPQNSSAPESSSEKYSAILKENQELHLNFEDTAKELAVLKSTHETLEKTLKDTKVNTEKELTELVGKLKKSEMENKIIYSELQKSKEHVRLSEEKVQEFVENSQKLAFILETYEKQVSSLKEELVIVKSTSKKESANQTDIEALEKAKQEQLDEALEKINSLENINKKLKGDFEKTISRLSQESGDLKRQLEEKGKEIVLLDQEIKTVNTNKNLSSEHLREIEKLNERIQAISSDKENLHKTYVNILTDNVKRYNDSEFVHNIQHETSEYSHLSEFSKQVEDIFKIQLDYKQKCERFEKQVLQISQEKTHIINEKNSEIEKLIQNSEILSQDVINKVETIKELETEVTNLMTSNDVLMSELDSFKNSGLQTISESNEDNLVLLETDLENAKKRISELERIVDNGGKIIISNGDSSTSVHDETNGKKEDYQDLLSSFDNLKIDYEAVKYDLADRSDLLDMAEIENEDLKSQLEKIKADFENTDYQLTEANFTVDSLKEELETIKLNLEEVNKENKELKLQNMNSIDIKSELNEIKEKWLTEENLRRELESQIRSVKEKQQNSKMTETSLKLQFDTLNKEHTAILDIKITLEQALASAKQSLAEYESNYTGLLQKYDDILLKCEEFNTKLHEKDTVILKLKNEFNVVEEQKQEVEKLLEEKIMQLQHYQHKQAAINEDLTKVPLLQLQIQEQTNQIARLAEALDEKEVQKLTLEKLTRNQAQEIQELARKDYSNKESLTTFEKQLHLAEEQVTHLKRALEESQEENKKVQSLLDKNSEDIAQFVQIKETESSIVDSSVSSQSVEKQQLQEEITKLQTDLKQSQDNILVLQQQMQELVNSRNELINVVTVKHQESLNYHNEIQRLSQILKSEGEKYVQLETQLVQVSSATQEIAKKNEEIDKLVDENSFLKEKCDVLAKNLLEEQSKLQQALVEKSGPSEKELSLSKQLERLQSHLVELEDHYTQELLQAEQKNAELQTKITGLEQREKTSSNMYTSVSIRANQQVESLQSQLQMVTNQRDELRKKMSDAEDANSKQAAALGNLQFVLEQFQKDKEKDVLKETERIRRQINAEKQVQENLKKEIDNLQEQLEESKIGLQAASRLSDQLEIVKKQNSGLKEEVFQLQQKLAKSQDKIHNLTSQSDGKIDKSLIKNLVVGLLSSGTTHNWNKDQTQVIKIIATVLDFNQQDHDKVKLNQPQQGSWLGSILFPQPSNNQAMSQESLSQAFIKFLENESKPRVVPSLLSEQSNRPSTSTESSKRTTPRASPIILNEIVLPTFADFGQNRNSSSILKDVLKDNNNS